MRIKILLAVALGFAMVFTISCGIGEVRCSQSSDYADSRIDMLRVRIRWACQEIYPSEIVGVCANVWEEEAKKDEDIRFLYEVASDSICVDLNGSPIMRRINEAIEEVVESRIPDCSKGVSSYYGCPDITKPPPPPSSSSFRPSSSSYSSFYSSSSSRPVSSSSYRQPSIVYGPSVNYYGEIYETVVIGTQTWLKRNLNYDPGTGNSSCYDNQEYNCAEYGRLYDWATAMALPNCGYGGYGTSCGGSIQPNHRGICPPNFHIPSNADWDKLMRYVDGSSGTGSPYYENPTAGRYLKTSDWGGEDSFGFSAMPGGSGYSGSFYSVGGYGYWWSASEDNINLAYFWSMDFNHDNAYWDYTGKISLFSVRCLQD